MFFSIGNLVRSCLLPFEDDFKSKILEFAGLWQPVVPSVVLPLVCENKDHPVIKLIGAYMVILAYLLQIIIARISFIIKLQAEVFAVH